MIKETRVQIDKISKSINFIGRSRYLSFSFTASQTSKMWLGKVLKEQGVENPYPESKNPENSVVEKTADTSEQDYFYDFKEIEAHSQDVKEATIKKCKFLRREIDSIVFTLKEDSVKHELFRANWKSIYTCEAILQLELCSMWLGMELSELNR